MLNAFILLVIALLFFVALFFIVFYFSQFFLNYKPSKKHIEKDLKKLREDLLPLVEKLVPWDEEEMSLLSLNNEESFRKRGGLKTRMGLMFSIYQEPLIAYGLKEYSDGKYGLLCARTSEHEYVYRIRPSGTEVYVDGQAYGRLVNGIELWDPQNKEVLARLKPGDERLIPISVKERAVGQLVDFKKTDSVNPRAYEFLYEMQEDQKQDFLALTLSYIIRNGENIA